MQIRNRSDRGSQRRRRPIRVTLASAQERNSIVAKARQLKQKGAPYNRVYLKKDINPIIRKETRRLMNRKFDEEKKPANENVPIEYDWQNRVLLRDGVVIDRFMPRFF